MIIRSDDPYGNIIVGDRPGILGCKVSVLGICLHSDTNRREPAAEALWRPRLARRRTELHQPLIEIRGVGFGNQLVSKFLDDLLEARRLSAHRNAEHTREDTKHVTVDHGMRLAESY